MSRDMREYGPTLGAPVWCQDFRSRDHLIPGGSVLNASEFLVGEQSVVVEATAIAAIDAVSVAVVALSGPIPAGTILDFGAKKFAQLSADADAGDESIAVEALATALADGDVAYYSASEAKSIPSGTAVGRTHAEKENGDGFGPAADADDEVYLLAFTVPDVSSIPACELLRYNAVVKENYLPGFDALSATVKGKIRANYRTILGHN